MTEGGGAAATTYFGTISDGGGGGTTALVHTGGFLSITSANTYSGGTTIDGGTLQATLATSVGAGLVDLNGGTFQAGANNLSLSNSFILQSDSTIDTQANTLILTGPIGSANSGGVSLNKIGTGTLIVDQVGLSPHNTINVRQGAVQAGATNALGQATNYNVSTGAVLDTNGLAQNIQTLTGGGVVTNNGGAAQILTVGANNTSDATPFIFAGTIQDGSSLVALIVDGTRPMIVTGSNTYTAGTLICDCATLQIGNGGSSGSIAGEIESGGTLIFDRSDAYTFSGLLVDDMGGHGKVVQEGGGTTVLTRANTYSGGTSLKGGALAVGNNSAIGTGAVTFDGGTLKAAGDYTIANPGAINANGGSIDSNGHIFTLSGDITNGAATTGGLTILDGVNGGGEVVLTGSNTYSGPTLVARNGALLAGSQTGLSSHSDFTVNGSLHLSGFSNAIRSLSGGGAVNNGAAGPATLTIAQPSGTATFSGVIQDGLGGGALSLVKTGAGAEILSGVNTYTGETAIDGGMLVINGVMQSSNIVVNAGGTLSGTGKIGDPTIAAGGTLAPGAGGTIGTLTIVGPLTFLTGSTFQAAITPTSNDSVAVTGATTIKGGTVNIVAGTGAYTTRRYTLLTSTAGVAGTFSAVTTTSDFAFLSPTLSYDANDVYLSVTQTKTLPSAALTPNQFSAATAIQALGSSAPLYNAVLGQSAAGARAAFDALSGEIHASAVSAAFDDARLPREAVLDRLASPYGGLATGGANGFAGANAIVAPMPGAQSFAAWGQAFGSWGHVGGDGNAATLDRSLGGFVLGADADLSDRYRLGAAAGYTQSILSGGARASSGRVDSTFIGLYGGAGLNALQLRGGAFYAYNRFATDRSIAFPGFTGAASSGYGGDTLQAFGEAGWRMPVAAFEGPTFVEPFIGALAMHIDTASYSEAGGAAALSGASQGYDYGATTLGVRAEATLFANIPLTARGMLGWRHMFGNVTPSSTMAFESAPSIPFAISGAPIARDALVAEAGFDWRLSKTATFGLFYSGALGSRDVDNAVKGKVEVAF